MPEIKRLNNSSHEERQVYNRYSDNNRYGHNTASTPCTIKSMQALTRANTANTNGSTARITNLDVCQSRYGKIQELIYER